jgi:hypothetical protein
LYVYCDAKVLWLAANIASWATLLHIQCVLAVARIPFQ